MNPDTARDTAWRRWLIAGYVAIAAVLAVLWGMSLASPIDKAEQDQQYRSLESVANAGSALLANSDIGADDAVQQLCDEGRLRVTLVDASGVVLADSVNDAATMENHASRPEVAAALAGDVGCAKRVSRTDGIEYLYLAIPATYQGSPCVLRVSETVSAVNAMAQDFRTASLVLLCIAIALAVAAAVVSFLRISRPVSHLERTRTDFVANASHELKTPIAGIALLAESIEQASADNDMEHVALFARQLKAETEHLHSLVIDLASLSRLESRRRAAPGKKTCDACAIVLASFESRRVLTEGKGLSMVLDNEIPAGETCTARISADNMTLVIDNLLDNAIRYTNTGSVTTALSQTPDEVSISVIDTGIGIPLEDQERVFERFYRVDKSHLRGGTGGTGLGLSLVRHAVKDAHGSIQLESMPGRGSIFIVKIPRA